MQDEAATNVQTERLTSMFPSRRILLVGLMAGLFVAWWGSFHEVACGCIKLHSVMSLFYLKLGCYMFSLGMAGAGAAFLVVGRRNRQHGSFAQISNAGTPFAIPIISKMDKPMLPWLAAAFLAFFGSCFYIALSAEVVPLAIGFLLGVHFCCALVAIAGIMMLADLPLSDIASATFLGLLCYLLFNNVVLPLTVGAIGSFYLAMALQALVLVVVSFMASAFLREVDNVALVEKGLALATSAHQTGEAAKRMAPQPLLNLCGYCLVFGLMHVEASMRFGDYWYRNLPYIVGMALATVLFYASFMRRGSTMRIWPKVQSVVFTLTIAAFMLLPVISTTSSIIPVALIEAAYFYYDALFVLACFVIARESALSLLTVLGLGFVVKGLSYFAGTLACHLQLVYFGESVVEHPVAILVVFLLLSAVTLWMGDTITAKKLWGMRIERAPRHNADASLIQERCDRLARACHLTPRESEVCAQLATGSEIEDVAETLHISIQTLRTHIRNIYTKTDVHARRELVKLMESMDGK